MLCTHCQREFNDKLHVPRLLVVCGHSLCQSCCYRLYLGNRVQCPDCHSLTYVESIALLPKNLALIASKMQDPPLTNRDQCPKHHKKYEAFCEKENVLICIECILQDGHKTHEMDSIHNCYEKYLALWSKKMAKIMKYGEKLGEHLVESKDSFETYKESYQSVRDLVSGFFREIREGVDREEENAMHKITEAYHQVEDKFSDKIKTTAYSVETLNSLADQLVTYEHLNESTFLESHSEREELYASFNQVNEEPVKHSTLGFSKKATVDALSKTFQAMVVEKVEKKGPGIAGSSYSSISNQIKKANDSSVGLKAAVRKVPITPPINNKKKMSIKKQLSTPPAQPLSLNKVTHSSNSSKEQNEANCRQLAEQIRADISDVGSKESLCHSFISNMTSFLTERKSIYLVGGFNQQANNIVKLNLFSFNWQDVCNLNSNRSKFGCVAHNRQIYLFGGKKGKERVGDAETFNLQGNKWSRATHISKRRSGFSVIALKEVLYFIGGNDGDNILNTVETLNLTSHEWKRKESMHQARDELSVVVSNNKIYAIGGFGGKDNQPLKSVQVYDPKTEKWRLIPSMNQPRRALAAAVLADGIYAIGGFDGTNYLNSVEKYEEGGRQWTSVAAMSQSRCTHSAVSISESQQIYVFGGFDYVPLDSVERYNVISNEWEPICRMPTVRFMHSSLLLKDE